MRTQLDNLKIMLNNSVYKYGLNNKRTLLIAARVDEEVTKVQKRMIEKWLVY